MLAYLGNAMLSGNEELASELDTIADNIENKIQKYLSPTIRKVDRYFLEIHTCFRKSIR